MSGRLDLVQLGTFTQSEPPSFTRRARQLSTVSLLQDFLNLRLDPTALLHALSAGYNNLSGVFRDEKAGYSSAPTVAKTFPVRRSLITCLCSDDIIEP